MSRLKHKRRPWERLRLAAVGAGLLTLVLPFPGRAQLTSEADTGQTDPPALLADSAGDRVRISELRTQGPAGAEDSFVEIHNGADAPQELTGWSIQYRGRGERTVSVAVPAGLVLPARTSLLFTGRQYSLNDYAVGDILIKEPIVDGIRLLDADSKTIDTVGSTAMKDKELCEGAGLPKWGMTSNVQWSFVRKVVRSALQDTDDNATDFALVSVTGRLGDRLTELGAPGPENMDNGSLRPATTLAKEPQDEAALVQRTSATSSPKRSQIRDTEARGTNRTYGTLRFRWPVTHTGSQPLSALSYRVDSITAGLGSVGEADIRILDSSSVESRPAGGNVGRQSAPLATALDEPPIQARGGGLNARVRVVLPRDTAIEPLAGIDMELLIGVERPGRYRLCLANELETIVLEGTTDSAVAKPTPGTRTAVRSGAGQASSSRVPGKSVVGKGAAPKAARGRAARSNARRAETARMLATVTFEGNTEDETEQVKVTVRPAPDEPSPLKLSTVHIEGPGGTILLRFNGPLDAESTTDLLNYSVSVNSKSVGLESAVYDTARNTIVLTLTPNVLHRGDSVVLAWRGINDARGRIVTGRIGPLVVR